MFCPLPLKQKQDWAKNPKEGLRFQSPKAETQETLRVCAKLGPNLKETPHVFSGGGRGWEQT